MFFARVVFVCWFCIYKRSCECKTYLMETFHLLQYVVPNLFNPSLVHLNSWWTLRVCRDATANGHQSVSARRSTLNITTTEGRDETTTTTIVLSHHQTWYVTRRRRCTAGPEGRINTPKPSVATDHTLIVGHCGKLPLFPGGGRLGVDWPWKRRKRSNNFIAL